MEYTYLKIRKYRTAENTPACMSFDDPIYNESCIFLNYDASRKKHYCSAINNRFIDFLKQTKEKNNIGYIKISKHCPIWSEEEKKIL